MLFLSQVVTEIDSQIPIAEAQKCQTLQGEDVSGGRTRDGRRGGTETTTRLRSGISPWPICPGKNN